MSRHIKPTRKTATYLLLGLSLANVVFWMFYVLSTEFRLWLPAREADVSLLHLLALLIWVFAAISCIWEINRWRRRSGHT
jgi:hypothetical protein